MRQERTTLRDLPGGVTVDEERKRISVTIFGEEYQMKAAASADYVQRLAARVDERMRQIAGGNPRLGTARVAVLTAMTLADDLQKMEEQFERLTRQLEEEWARHQRR